MTPIAQQRADLIQKLHDQAAKAQALLDEIRSGATPDAFIITNTGPVYLRFRQENGKTIPSTAAALYADRFATREEADALAVQCRNGADTVATSVALSLALDEQIASNRNLVAALEEAAAHDNQNA